MKQTLSVPLVLALVGAMFLVGVTVIELFRHPYDANASQSQGNDYLATSTAVSPVFGASNLTSGVMKTGQGALANVTVTGATAIGGINFYDATTTDITKRATGQSTSTILIATIAPAALGGTYVFDIEYTTGLMYDVPSGSVPSTTISYR